MDRDPTPDDDENAGWHEGSLWIAGKANSVWACKSASPGRAVWHRIVESGAAATEPLYMTVGDAAKRWGLSKRWIYLAAKAGKLPVRYFGSAVRIDVRAAESQGSRRPE